MNRADLRKKYTRTVKMCGKWNTYLQVGVQGFCVVEQTTKKRALWYADMLAGALENVVKEASEK